MKLTKKFIGMYIVVLLLLGLAPIRPVIMIRNIMYIAAIVYVILYFIKKKKDSEEKSRKFNLRSLSEKAYIDLLDNIEPDSQLKIIEDNADENDYAALCFMGQFLRYGQYGFSVDPERAFDYLKRSAEQKYSRAYLDLAYCYKEGFGCQKAPEEAFHYFLLATQNDPALKCDYTVQRTIENLLYHPERYFPLIYKANYELALCYETGFGCHQDLKQAFEHYNEASDLPEAQLHLARMYTYGSAPDGCDFDKAREYYRSLELRHPEMKTACGKGRTEIEKELQRQKEQNTKYYQKYKAAQDKKQARIEKREQIFKSAIDLYAENRQAYTQEVKDTFMSLMLQAAELGQKDAMLFFVDLFREKEKRATDNPESLKQDRERAEKYQKELAKAGELHFLYQERKKALSEEDMDAAIFWEEKALEYGLTSDNTILLYLDKEKELIAVNKYLKEEEKLAAEQAEEARRKAEEEYREKARRRAEEDRARLAELDSEISSYPNRAILDDIWNEAGIPHSPFYNEDKLRKKMDIANELKEKLGDDGRWTLW